MTNLTDLSTFCYSVLSLF